MNSLENLNQNNGMRTFYEEKANMVSNYKENVVRPRLNHIIELVNELKQDCLVNVIGVNNQKGFIPSADIANVFEPI